MCIYAIYFYICTLCVCVFITGICKSTLAQLKISPRTAAVFKFKYQYQYVFYENLIFLHID